MTGTQSIDFDALLSCHSFIHQWTTSPLPPRSPTPCSKSLRPRHPWNWQSGLDSNWGGSQYYPLWARAPVFLFPTPGGSKGEGERCHLSLLLGRMISWRHSGEREAEKRKRTYMQIWVATTQKREVMHYCNATLGIRQGTEYHTAQSNTRSKAGYWVSHTTKQHSALGRAPCITHHKATFGVRQGTVYHTPQSNAGRRGPKWYAIKHLLYSPRWSISVQESPYDSYYISQQHVFKKFPGVAVLMFVWMTIAPFCRFMPLRHFGDIVCDITCNKTEIWQQPMSLVSFFFRKPPNI